MHTDPLLYVLRLTSENHIIEKILLGEVALFEVLIRRFNAVLYKIGRGYGFNHQDTEDLMQETHVSAYRNLSQFEGRASYKTWISKIMIHKCLYKLNYGYAKNEQPGSDLINDQAGLLQSQNQQDGPESRLIKKEFSVMLENALQHISLTYRSVFILREIEGFSVAETAELVGITPVNVKVRLNRAKALLQKQLESFYSGKDIYMFHLVHCDALVKKVYDMI
jgi:RNA polymerase sigma factor (sigma-70 family)